MDVRFINPFLYAARDVLKKMAFIEPVPGKPFLKKTDTAGGDVSAIIGLTGDTMGSLALSFSEECICNITGNMVGEVYTEANAEVFDAAGEITNMVSGAARSHLEKDGFTIFAAIPSIIYGKGHTFQHILNAPSIVIPFSTDKGNFIVDVCIRTLNEQERKQQVYDVVNVKTAVLNSSSPQRIITRSARENKADSPSRNQGSPGSGPEAGDGPERLELFRGQLSEMVKARESLNEALLTKPFMPLEKRSKYKKDLLVLDQQIRRLKLEVKTLEIMTSSFLA